MMIRLKDHLRHHAIAYVALFIVLGGSAVALPGKGSVDSGDIKKKAVKSKNIAKKAVKSKNIANQAVKTKNLADGAVEAAKLAGGAVGTAKLADGAVTANKSSGLVEGEGEVYTRSFTVDAVGFLPDPKPVIAEVPTMGVVELLGCFGGPSYSIRTRLLSFDDAPEFYGVGTVTGSDLPSGVNPAGVLSDQTAGTFGSGGGSPLIANGGGVGTAGHWEWSLWREDGDDVQGAQVSIDGWNNAGIAGPAQCRFHATVVQND
jgi:hypothetical protein